MAWRMAIMLMRGWKGKKMVNKYPENDIIPDSVAFYEDNSNDYDRNIIFKRILYIIAIVAVGLFIINSFFSYRYKLELLSNPCSLCQQQNKEQAQCVKGCFEVRLINQDGKYCGADGQEYKKIEGRFFKANETCDSAFNVSVPNYNFSLEGFK